MLDHVNLSSSKQPVKRGIQHIPVKSKGFVIVADPHLRSRIWADRHDIVGDNYRAFRKATGLAIERGYDLVVLGDLFDSPRPSSQDVYELSFCLSLLSAVGLKMFSLQGNHDFSDPPWPQTLFMKNSICAPATLRFEDTTKEGNPTVAMFVLQDFQSPKDEGSSSAFAWDSLGINEQIKHKVFLGHQTPDCFTEFKFGSNLKAEYIKGYDLAIFGDYHTPELGRGPNCPCISPGSLCLNRWGEDHVPTALVFSFDNLLRTGDLSASFARVPIPGRPRTSVYIPTEETVPPAGYSGDGWRVEHTRDVIRNFLGNNPAIDGALPLVRIYYSGSAHALVELGLIKEPFTGQCHFFQERVVSTKDAHEQMSEQFSPRALMDTSLANASDALDVLVDRNTEGEVYTMASDVLTAASSGRVAVVREVIERQYQK